MSLLIVRFSSRFYEDLNSRATRSSDWRYAHLLITNTFTIAKKLSSVCFEYERANKTTAPFALTAEASGQSVINTSTSFSRESQVVRVESPFSRRGKLAWVLFTDEMSKTVE